ncbi:MAG: hypothetical protein Q4B58_04260 [Bacteroidales bacterium]|nr:hypothetical protein [Bacteroidales bacterium]
MKSQYKMLGIVTLFNPNEKELTEKLEYYLHDIDHLIVWDNSPISHEDSFSLYKDIVTYHWTGENTCIAAAINFALEKAIKEGFDLLLLMDQDSRWENFHCYRQNIEHLYETNPQQVFTPYIEGNDQFQIQHDIEYKSLFINSGTVFPVSILQHIGGADEALPLDALDHDLSYRIRAAGFPIICITKCILRHTIGQPKRKGPFNLFTNDYGRFRTYSITRGHIICYRKNRHIMTAYEVRKFYKEIFMWKMIRIILVEEDKWGRFCALCKGIRDGINYKIAHS